MPRANGPSNAVRRLKDARGDGHLLARHRRLDGDLCRGLEQRPANTGDDFGGDEGGFVAVLSISHVDEVDHDTLAQHHQGRPAENPDLHIFGVLHADRNDQAEYLKRDSKRVASRR